MANISDFSFRFSDVASLAWIPRGIFSIKWWQIFRACLNKLKELVSNVTNQKNIEFKYDDLFIFKLEIWEFFKEITGILQHNILLLI